MQTANVQLPDDTEGERVIRWRLHQLQRAGYDWPAAMSVAAAGDIDLHVATGLLRNGCPLGTALGILL